ncbi:acyl homoserine lactone synthase [Yoonia maritima]|uniref:Acyl-homoserine-lactone synthase n=1 Tax=Yoonia maritima TaxID=1435347 RepID=A0A2T0W4E1_9RHOB|nr:acyl-homoserine-lactone synthase [Yoonia maritima]PRY80327.1 acyl homoserine lactone synthase [Yoonia maritima]
MENISFNFAQLHQYGTAFYEFLALRKQFFVDQLGWDIPHDDSVEMDQYDNPNAHYSLVLRDGKVIGGMRAMATTAQWGSHTYMLRDAVAGKLIGIPEDIIKIATVTPNVWEATRVVISDEVKTQAERSECLGLVLDGVVDQATANGGTEIMALCPPVFARTLRQLGYDVDLIGDPYVNCHDNRRYVAMSMPAKHRRKTKVANSAAQVRKVGVAGAQAPLHAPSVK